MAQGVLNPSVTVPYTVTGVNGTLAWNPEDRPPEDRPPAALHATIMIKSTKNLNMVNEVVNFFIICFIIYFIIKYRGSKIKDQGSRI